MSKHYEGPAPHHGPRIYGQRLLAARQIRGLSRNKLGTMLNIEASRLRALERADFTTLEGREDIQPQLSFMLGFPPMWFRTPMDPEFTERAADRNTFLCQSMESRTCECGGEATLLCDGPAESGTCDAPLCAECTTKRKGEDRCSAHSRMRKHPDGMVSR